MRPGDEGLELYVAMTSAMNTVRDNVWDSLERETAQRTRADELWELADTLLDELTCAAENRAVPTDRGLDAYRERLDALAGDAS